MMTAPRYSRPTTVATAGTDRLTQRTTTAHSGSKTKRRASPPPPVDILDTKTGKRYTRGRFLGKVGTEEGRCAKIDHKTPALLISNKRVSCSFQGGFARCFEMIDKETNEIFAGKVVPKRKLVKQHAKDKVGHDARVKVESSLSPSHLPSPTPFPASSLSWPRRSRSTRRWTTRAWSSSTASLRMRPLCTSCWSCAATSR